MRVNAEKTGDKPAIITDARTMSWAELWSEVESASASIAAELSNSEQQLVSLLMPNSWEYVVAYLAVLHAGHIAVPIDVIYKPLEINAIIRQMAPAMIIADQANADRLDASPINRQFNDLQGSGQKSPSLLRIGEDKQIATIFFTSGTTGKPKAAPYTHANHIWNIRTCSQAWDWNSADSLLLSLRLSHWYGSVMGLSGALYHGNTTYVQDRFSAVDTLELLASGKISIFTHAPLAYAKMLEISGPYDISKTRLFISGSGPLPPRIWQEFKSKYGQEILEVYGSSETGRIASNLLNERLPGSPGRILPTVQAKIGERNELLIKSPGVFPGYYKNPELTAKSMVDGWWRTGDMAEIKDGRIYLKGRFAEVVRKYGYTVSPRDVEWAMLTNPAVKEVAVMGAPRAGEPDDELVFFIVSELADETIMEFCRRNLPSVWRPDRIVKLDEIPRTMSGKVNIPKLRSLL